MSVKKLKFLISPLICLFIIGTIYLINGFYPFGSNSIIQVDADYQYVPILYYIYDFLHGRVNLLYSGIGLGNNIYVSTIIQGSLYSPINLFLYLTSRDNIVNYFNILLFIKISLISLTAYIYINKRYRKISDFYKNLFAVLYAFSGFILFNYFNIMWLDCVILFPLIVMFLEELMDNNRPYGYIIFVSLSLLVSIYISYYILFFIIFYSYIYLQINYSKEELLKKVSLLGYSTLIAFLISSISILPAIYQLVNSSRFLSYVSTYNLDNNMMLKSLYLLTSPLFIIFFIKYFFKSKILLRRKYVILITFIFFAIGIILEPINLSIHAGSYWNFPYRYGFITTFILLKGSLEYLLTVNNSKGIDKFKILKLIVWALLFGVIIIGNYLVRESIIREMIFLDLDNITLYLNILIIIFLIIIVTIISISFNSKRERYFLLGCSTILSIMVFTSWTMFYNEGYYLTKTANDLNDNLNFESDGRYKMDYSVYTPDYGLIFNVDTLDNWLHVIPQNELTVYDNLGYYVNDTSVKSYGGTIFSDYFLNTKYVLSNTIKDSDIYTLLQVYDNNYLYKYNYRLPYGFVYSKKESISFQDEFQYQNDIYKNLFGTDLDLIKVINYQESGQDIKINYDVSEKGILYFKTESIDDINYLKISDKTIFIDGDYILDLGVYDENIEIFISKNSLDDIEFSLGFVSWNDLLGLSSLVRYDLGKYYVDNICDDDSYLVLPINDISGMRVYLNDELVKVEDYLDNFIMVKLKRGSNIISIKYEMPFFKIGLILSIVGIISFFFWRKIQFKTCLNNVVYCVYNFLFIVLFGYYYIYSMIKWILNI